MRRVAGVVGFVLLCLLLPVTRVVWSSHSELRAGDRASSPTEQIFHYGLAARLYAPGNPYSEQALARLTDEGRKGSRSPEALAAWQAVRSALLSTRSFYTPHPALLAEANEQLAQLWAAQDDPRRGTLAERQAWHRDRLALDEAPQVSWTLLALLGLVTWVGAGFYFFSRALDGNERIRRRPAVLATVGVILGLVLFAIGLLRA